MKFTIPDILSAFMSDKPRKKSYGNYKFEGDRLVYQAQTSKDIHRWSRGDAEDFADSRKIIGEMIRKHDGKLSQNGKPVLLESLTKDSDSHDLKIQYFETEFIAQKVKTDKGTVYLGNSDTLGLVGRSVAYGHVNNNQHETEIQVYMQQNRFSMMPLNQFADKDLSSLKILDSGVAVRRTIQRQVKAGRSRYDTKTLSLNIDSKAMLFSLDDNCYLSDNEVRNNNDTFAFVIQLPKNVTTLKDAYQSLKPIEVLDAESKGIAVKRFGSYFLVPTNPPTIPTLTTDEKIIILAAHTSFYLDESTIKHIAGKTYSTKDTVVKETLAKVPRAVNFGSKNASCGIILNRVFYCKDEVTDSDGKSSVKFSGWHQLVPRVGKELSLKK